MRRLCLGLKESLGFRWILVAQWFRFIPGVMWFSLEAELGAPRVWHCEAPLITITDLKAAAWKQSRMPATAACDTGGAVPVQSSCAQETGYVTRVRAVNSYLVCGVGSSSVKFFRLNIQIPFKHNQNPGLSLVLVTSFDFWWLVYISWYQSIYIRTCMCVYIYIYIMYCMCVIVCIYTYTVNVSKCNACMHAYINEYIYQYVRTYIHRYTDTKLHRYIDT